jgi:hypothetical protein
MPRSAAKEAAPNWIVPLREIGPLLTSIAMPTEEYADKR